MQHPQSPHRASSADLSGGLGAIQHSADVFCPSPPLHPQNSSHSTSPRSSSKVSSMTSAVQEPNPSIEYLTPPSPPDISDFEPMQWAAPSSFAINHMGQDRTAYNTTMPCTPGSGSFYPYAQNGFSYNGNYNYLAQFPSSRSCPRSYNEPNLASLPNESIASESYPPAAYQLEAQQHHDALDLSDPEIKSQLMQLSSDYENHHYGASRIKIEDLADYQSPYLDLTRASTPHDDSATYTSEDGTIDKEQPYAQLIYQALLQAPNNTMILRDIYDWFRRYTDKASASETKGWQNSIRHNLSMNGVCPLPSSVTF